MVAFHVNLDLVDYAKKEEGRNKKGGRGGRIHEVGRESCWKGWRKLERKAEMDRSFYTCTKLSRT